MFRRLLLSLFLPIILEAAPGGTIEREEDVKPYVLPNPLVCLDGTPVTEAKQWLEKRRPELLGLFESEIYGKTKLGRPEALKFVLREEAKNARSGKATRLRVGILFEGKEDGRQMELLVYLPNDVPGPVPVFLGLNFDGNYSIVDDPDLPVPTHFAMGLYTNKLVGNRPTEAGRGIHSHMWQVDWVLEQGYGIATAAYGQIEPDADGRWKEGPRALGPEPGAGDWGCVGAWAWGLSRAMDYLETNPRVSAKQVAVMGFSRLGKAAMWAGAQDPRFALVVSNASGAGGLALHKRIFGETVAASVRLARWYTPGFLKYANKEEEMPIDSHELAALIAPRPLLSTCGTKDLWSDPKGEFLAEIAADPVYRLLGTHGMEAREWPPAGELINQRMGYYLREGGHDVTLEDWRAMVAFASKNGLAANSPLTAQARYASRLAALSEPDRQTWSGWLEHSDRLRQKNEASLLAELKELGLGESKQAPQDGVPFQASKDAEFYKSKEAQDFGVTVISYQLPCGGWSKAVDYKLGPRARGTRWTTQGATTHYAGTIDNRSTTEQLKFLARLQSASPEESVRMAVERGLDYLLAAQYPNGGWAQCYPLEGAYHDALTLNDDAMVHVLEVLQLVASGRGGFAWMDAERKAAAAKALAKGNQTLLDLQVVLGGQATIWAAQYDPWTLNPVSARGFEPVGLSGGESVAVVRYLMKLRPNNPRIDAAIQSALTWFEQHKLPAEGSDSEAKKWARFYDLRTQQPFFPGKRDGRRHSTLDAMLKENPGGYDFTVSSPAELLGGGASKWRAEIGQDPLKETN